MAVRLNKEKSNTNPILEQMMAAWETKEGCTASIKDTEQRRIGRWGVTWSGKTKARKREGAEKKNEERLMMTETAEMEVTVMEEQKERGRTAKHIWT